MSTFEKFADMGLLNQAKNFTAEEKSKLFYAILFEKKDCNYIVVEDVIYLIEKINVNEKCMMVFTKEYIEL
jgi:hypothetical protein